MNNPYKLNHQKYSTHSVVKQQLGRVNVVLDVGCNDGYLGLDDKGNNVFYGLDISELSIQHARFHYKDAVTMDLNETSKKLPWDIKFDVILFADVLEHLVNPGKVLSHYKQYLKADGRVILSLPNIANWRIRLSLLFGNFTYADSGILDRTHLHFYTFETAKKLALDAGFNVKMVFSGASIFGPIINRFTFLRGMLATNIILILENVKR